jgi:hypothetical protein
MSHYRLELIRINSTAVRERMASSMAQRVRMTQPMIDTGTLADRCKYLGETVARELPATLANKDVRAVSLGTQGPQGTSISRRQVLYAIDSALLAGFQVERMPLQPNQLRHPQTVMECQTNHQSVAGAVTSRLRGADHRLDLDRRVFPIGSTIISIGFPTGFLHCLHFCRNSGFDKI